MHQYNCILPGHEVPAFNRLDGAIAYGIGIMAAY
jgi:hypothetical protein